ncbi:MAG: hypothetical protein ABR951_03310 [Candidatus Aminicenantales bacterium]|jgi:hypothetical protein
MDKRAKALTCGCAFLGAMALALWAAPGPRQAGLELIKKVTVAGNAGWVDTGLDAAQGDEFFFKASGEISLQRGNPSANCGPAGLDLMTAQQPILNQNLGALIGKVAQLVSVRTDEDTGEEIRDEIVEYFFVGAEGSVTVPIRGRLYLGVNEDVIKDNGGEFTVLISQRKR